MNCVTLIFTAKLNWLIKFTERKIGLKQEAQPVDHYLHIISQHLPKRLFKIYINKGPLFRHLTSIMITSIMLLLVKVNYSLRHLLRKACG